MSKGTVVAGIAGALLVASLGSSTAVAGDGSSSDPLGKANSELWKPVAPSVGEVTYPGVGVRTQAAPEGASTAVDRSAALANPKVKGGLAVGDPDVELRMFQTGDFTKETLTEPRLGWVFTFHNSPMILRGKYSEVPREGLTSPVPCTLTVIVDAATADVPAEFQIC